MRKARVRIRHVSAKHNLKRLRTHIVAIGGAS